MYYEPSLCYIMDPQELVPLESGLPPRRPTRQLSQIGSRSCYKGPIRLCRLLGLMIVLPCFFIFMPLYMRYRVFSGQMYPMSMTDMRLIDGRISPTWCQRQVVKSNATFNAFVVPGPPELTDELVSVSMTRELELEDDMKEYWGFYLLQGSAVTVSSCVRWPGASLIMIKGYKHLQECAYIGDDSSEELDELIEAHKLGLLTNATLLEKIYKLKKEDGKANDPGTMKRHKAGINFHDPKHKTNATSSASIPTVDVTDHDPKELREILEKLHAIRQAAKTEALKYYHPPSHLMSLPALHRHREPNIDREERPFLSFKDIDGNISEPVPTTDKKVLKPNTIPKEQVKANSKINSKASIINTINNKSDYNGFNTSKAVERKEEDIVTDNKTNQEVVNTKSDYNGLNKSKAVERKEEDMVTDNKTNQEVKPNEEISSKEVYEKVLKQLQSLGDKGKRVLTKLHETMGLTEDNKITGKTMMLTGSEEEMDHLSNILVEAIDEEKTKAQRQEKRREAREDARQKRELMLGQIELQKQLNEDDEARDYAAEEGLEPDGFAEHHEQINETTPYDMSNSEFWSSFSSSEEALLECAGLILNLPLTPHSSCQPGSSDQETLAASGANALTYRVPANGYYFFVFSSENEVQRNFIRARFDLQKTRYDVARTALRECTNSTDRCDLPLDIFSSQKVVLELPLRNNDSLWNEQFVIISECEPRTSVYVICVIAVPVLILTFGFQ